MTKVSTIPRVLQVLSLNVDVLEKARKFGFLAYSVSLHGYEDLEKSGMCDVVLYRPNSKISGKSKFVRVLRSLYNQYRILKQCRSVDALYLSADEHYLLIFICKYLRILKVPIVLLNHFTYDYRNTKGILKALFLWLERKLLISTVESLIHSSESIRDYFDDCNANTKIISDVGFWGGSKAFVDDVKDRLDVTQRDYIFAPGAANRNFQPVIDACKMLQQPLTILTTSQIAQTLVYDKNIVTVEIFDTNDPEIFEKLWRHYLECTAILIPIGASNHVPNGASVVAEALLARKPVVASRSDAVFIDIEKSGIGLFVDTALPEDWQKAIITLKRCFIDNRDVHQNLAWLAKRYNSEKLSEILMDNFRKVVDG